MALPMSPTLVKIMQGQLKLRKLRDIKELITKPYPGIKLHVKEENIDHACLIITPEGGHPLHLSVRFPDSYPLDPPRVSIQSHVVHPNVFDGYICATILNDKEDFTSAYTLKSIAIQILSFFSDERIESAHGSRMIDVKQYREELEEDYKIFGGRPSPEPGYQCILCGFGVKNPEQDEDTVMTAEAGPIATPNGCPIAKLPFELILMICDELDTEELIAASSAWSRFNAALHHLVPVRNIQCFTLKKGTKDVNIGVGIMIDRGTLSSEFDYVSDVAFRALGVRRSIHGLPFKVWLPLALNERHWSRVKGAKLDTALSQIQAETNKNGSPLVHVLYALMNDVVVKLSDKANDAGQRGSKSTLKHASEKAVESYFALFHLLVCMAIDNPLIITAARKTVDDFTAGSRNKNAVPNLGQFLVARLLSDADRGASQTAQQQEAVTMEIVKEAIVRNVVWMLSSQNSKFGNHPELAYLEPSAYSSYRCFNTYRASMTSYRLLMFQDLMRRTVLATYGGKPLTQIRDELFKRHGAPPEGAAARLAAEIKAIQTVDCFASFFPRLDVKQPPTKEAFTSFLRESIQLSVDAGYSRTPLSQDEALWLRQKHEVGVEIAAGVRPRQHHGRLSFFPDAGRGGGGGGNRRGGAAGGGRGRGRGRGGWR